MTYSFTRVKRVDSCFIASALSSACRPSTAQACTHNSRRKDPSTHLTLNVMSVLRVKLLPSLIVALVILLLVTPAALAQRVTTTNRVGLGQNVRTPGRTDHPEWTDDCAGNHDGRGRGSEHSYRVSREQPRRANYTLFKLTRSTTLTPTRSSASARASSRSSQVSPEPTIATASVAAGAYVVPSLLTYKAH